jgi:hypothetical protein
MAAIRGAAGLSRKRQRAAKAARSQMFLLYLNAIERALRCQQQIFGCEDDFEDMEI